MIKVLVRKIFLSCVCPKDKNKIADTNPENWICGSYPGNTRATCNGRFNTSIFGSDSVYTQMNNCYGYTETDCIFKYGTINNTCESEDVKNCSQMNMEYGGPTGINRLTGWKSLSEEDQIDICQNKYSKHRGLNCGLYTGMDNECGFKNNLEIFELYFPEVNDVPGAMLLMDRRFIYNSPDQVDRHTSTVPYGGGSTNDNTVTFNKGIYVNTMKELYKLMGITYIRIYKNNPRTQNQFMFYFKTKNRGTYRIKTSTDYYTIVVSIPNEYHNISGMTGNVQSIFISELHI